MKNRIKKIIYSAVSIIMVLILSMPVVVYANNNKPRFITYECVKDMYEEGSWKHMEMVQMFYNENCDYDIIAPHLESIPFELSNYDYYVFYVKSGTLYFSGFYDDSYSYIITGPQGYLSMSGEESRLNTLKTTYENRLKYVTGVPSSSVADGLIMLYMGSGSYDDYKVSLSGTDEQWTCVKLGGTYTKGSNSYKYTYSLKGCIVDTNLDIYSGYQLAMEKEADYSGYRWFLDEAVLDLDILNVNMKYFDGENIVGGSPNYDLTMGFSGFTIEKINHPDVLFGTGALLNWSLTPETLENITPEWNIRMNYKVSYQMYSVRDGFLSDRTTFDSNEFYHTVEVPLESYIKQNGSYMYDLQKAYDDGVMYACCFGMIVDSVKNGNISYSFSDSFVGRYLVGMGNIVGNVSNAVMEEDSSYGFDYVNIGVEIQLVNTKTNVISNSCTGNVDLISGRNSALTNEVLPDGSGQTPSDTGVSSGNNYYNVVTETDTNGNTYYNYYYYDTTNNTVTPSIGTVPDTLTLFFGNPLTLNGVSGGGSSSSSSSGGSGDNINVTIEDDDYTDLALRDDLIDGFGLLDNNETEELDDGFLSVAAAFFESIDPDASQILMFGLSSVVAVNILRAIFRR